MLQCLLAAAIGATARKPHAATANKLSMFGMFLWELLLFLYICTATQRDWSNFISKVGTAKYLDPGVAGKLKAEAEGKYHFISIVFTGTILCTTKNVFFCYWNCDLLKHLLRLALPAFLTRPLLLCSFFLCVILLSISTTNKTKVLLVSGP